MTVEPKRRVLGKGLASLIPDGSPLDIATEEGATGAGAPIELPIDAIRPNPRQPRNQFDPEEIDSLADSIRQHGVLQPLLVRVDPGGGYTLVAGERRLRAARKAGLATVPVITRAVDDDHLLEIALIENIQRDDLGPLETARAFRTLVRELGLTQVEVAERVGKPRSTVANFLRLLDLPEAVQQLLDDGKLEMGHGRALAGLDDPALQEKLGLGAASGRWSVRETEARVKKAAEGTVAGEGNERRDPNVVAAEKTLARALEAGVTIHMAKNGKGKIEIRFSGDEDLDRLYRALIRTTQKPA